MSADPVVQEHSSAPETEAPCPVDLITDIQQKISSQSRLLYTFLGALQRDAPAEVVITDSLVYDLPEAPSFQETLQLPRQIISDTRKLEDLIAQIPDNASEAEELQAIVKLQQESNELDIQLAQETRLAEEVLLGGLELHKLLAHHELDLRSIGPVQATAHASASEK